MEGAEGHELVGHTWYADADRKGRRLALRVHAERRQISLSLWDDNSCRATYHLSLSDVPDLIRDLAAALAEAARPGEKDPTTAAGAKEARRRDDPIAKTAQLAVSALRKGARLLEPYTRTSGPGTAANPEETTVLKLFQDPGQENPPS